MANKYHSNSFSSEPVAPKKSVGGMVKELVETYKSGKKREKEMFKKK